MDSAPTMRLVGDPEAEFRGREQPWPLEARAALLALESAPPSSAGRRSRVRHRARLLGAFDQERQDLGDVRIFVRDVNGQTLGFIANQEIAVGRSGLLRIDAPDGAPLHVRCRVGRCRLFMEGWYEGYLEFDRPLPPFDRAA